MDNNIAQKINDEASNTYDAFADDFSRTRVTFWQELSFIKDYIKEKAAVLDVGCGNGRLLTLIDDKPIDYTGIDVSQKLISIAQKTYPNKKFDVGTIHSLPYKDNTFDTTISIAVLHHIPGQELRERSIKEIARVTKKGGIIIITVWNAWKTRKKDLFFELGKRIIGKSELPFGDAFMSFNKKKNARYIHAFKEKELEGLAKNAGLTIVKLSIYMRPSGEENFVLVAKK